MRRGLDVNAIEHQAAHLVHGEPGGPRCGRWILPKDLDILHGEVSGVAQGQRGAGVFVGRVRIAGDEQLDAIQANAVQPAFRLPVDDRGSGAVRDDIADGYVADHAGRRLLLALGSVYLAAALDVEVDGIAVTPPEPVESAGLYGDVRNYYVLDDSAVKHHEREAAIRVRDDDVVDGNAANGFRVPIAELERARGRG